MSLVQKFEKICRHLGTNNKPVYVAMTIAAVKGIFRPGFTLMEKKEKPETKKYTALREGITELIAIPTYFICDKIAECFAKPIKDKYKARNAKTSLGFVGVCTAALFVIPWLCSISIKPIMDKIGIKAPHNTFIEPQKTVTSYQPVKVKKQNTASLNSMNTFLARPDIGLRAGKI